MAPPYSVRFITPGADQPGRHQRPRDRTAVVRGPLPSRSITMPISSLDDVKLAIIGLGYVGLPLAVEFGKHRSVIGFDINPARINALKQGVDSTLEVSREELAESKGLEFTTDLDALKSANVYIVTVPTPIDEHKRPDLTPLIKASETIEIGRASCRERVKTMVNDA